MSLLYALEKEVAIAAVLRACSSTASVFNKLVKSEKLTKGDKSPVTVGDFAAQAVVSTILGQAFPQDPIVGEEDADDLRGPAATSLRERVVELANSALTESVRSFESVKWGIGPGQQRSADELLAAIDRGNYSGGSSGRMWTLDPIDGTKGFLRGEQYAVCLAFIVDSKVQVGVIGCPNLPLSLADPNGSRGCLFVAVRGQGAEQRTLDNNNPVPLHMPDLSPENLNTLESAEAAHAAFGFQERIARALNITRQPTRMDSQAKYGALARGDGGIYLRMPVGSGYQEKIWDHAAGSLLIEEAGGVISDSRGEPLNFGLGRFLGENFGIIAAGRAIHPSVIKAISQVQEEEKTDAKTNL